MKKKALCFLALASCMLLAMPTEVKATDSGTTWGMVGTALGATSLGLQVYDRVNNRRQGQLNTCRNNICQRRQNRYRHNRRVSNRQIHHHHHHYYHTSRPQTQVVTYREVQRSCPHRLTYMY